jgi:hypothetical protein
MNLSVPSGVNHDPSSKALETSNFFESFDPSSIDLYLSDLYLIDLLFYNTFMNGKTTYYHSLDPALRSEHLNQQSHAMPHFFPPGDSSSVSLESL